MRRRSRAESRARRTRARTTEGDQAVLGLPRFGVGARLTHQASAPGRTARSVALRPQLGRRRRAALARLPAALTRAVL